MNTETTNVLSEILITPSTETIENRFTTDNEQAAAACSGSCKSKGGCVTATS